MAMMRFDARTTREVEDGRKEDGKMVLQPRSMWNRKPYRTKQQKLDAKKHARVFMGTHTSLVDVSYHPDPSSKQARQREEANI